MIWGCDVFSGSMFNFNGDGKTDTVEAAIGFQFLDELRKEGEDDDEENDS